MKAIDLLKPDDMISWLNDLNSNWSVCRNTRSFLEGQPAEYWKKFDALMGEAFELQVSLMKLVSSPATLRHGPLTPHGEDLELQIRELQTALFLLSKVVPQKTGGSYYDWEAFVKAIKVIGERLERRKGDKDT